MATSIIHTGWGLRTLFGAVAALCLAAVLAWNFAPELLVDQIARTRIISYSGALGFLAASIGGLLLGRGCKLSRGALALLGLFSLAVGAADVVHYGAGLPDVNSILLVPPLHKGLAALSASPMPLITSLTLLSAGSGLVAAAIWPAWPAILALCATLPLGIGALSLASIPFGLTLFSSTPGIEAGGAGYLSRVVMFLWGATALMFAFVHEPQKVGWLPRWDWLAVLALALIVLVGGDVLTPLTAPEDLRLTVVLDAIAAALLAAGAYLYRNLLQTQEVRARNIQLEAEQHSLRALNRQKDEMLSVISHELRTPLNFITGFTSIIRDRTTEQLSPDELQRYLARIDEGADRMIHLVNDLLDVAALQLGHL
ncbi:MAG: hypothetical protein KGR26_15035, partial [Cyanobacteria bacterium REEB65]|nr:hypothetical protein [Cyanobacteria bacterium REEB65]